MQKKFLCAAAAAVGLLWGSLGFSYGEMTVAVMAGDLEVNAEAAVVMDADSGRVLFEKDGFTVRSMASTTKIMTCILALENGDPDDEVLVSAYAASMPDVQLNIREGERYRLGDLLCSLMLESHNDTAVAIAEHIGGSVEGFAAMMNQKARDLGCSDTCFVTPNGLDGTDENGGEHSTTGIWRRSCATASCFPRNGKSFWRSRGRPPTASRIWTGNAPFTA